MSSVKQLSIKANHLFFYYKDLAQAQRFYEKILGLRRVLDYGYASIHQISATTYVGLVDEAKGVQQATEPKTVTLSFITQEIDAWYQYLTNQGVKMHHRLADATRHPTRGFVAVDPEGYFLEFETFLPHEQNWKLRDQLSRTKSSFPTRNFATTRPNNLGIQGNVIWLYYNDLAVAQEFYEDIMGFRKAVDQGFAKVYGSSETGFIGLVDQAQGLHRFSETKAVTIAFFTNDVPGRYAHFKNGDIPLHTPDIKIENDAVELFVAYDNGSYFLEFDHFLDCEENQKILATFSNGQV